LSVPPQLLSFIPPPPIPEIISAGIIFAFTYMATQFFVLYSLSYLLSLSSPPSHWSQPALLPQAGTVLPFCSEFVVEKKKINDMFAYVFASHRELPCAISMYVCIITLIG
jgi:hypothetical protein